MKNNTSLHITDLKTINAVLDQWGNAINERIWRQMGLTVEKAKRIVNEIPADLPVYEWEKNYLRRHAEAFLKAKDIQ